MSPESRLADAYFKLLVSLDWSDPLLIAGLREGLNKFLSNAYISIFPGVNKYHRTRLASPAAIRNMQGDDYGGLVYEHLVPKTRYIQRPCEERAAAGDLRVDFIADLLKRYWLTATVTKAEDRQLERFSMPRDWDGHDVFARYRRAGIELLPNPFFPSRADI